MIDILQPYEKKSCEINRYKYIGMSLLVPDESRVSKRLKLRHSFLLKINFFLMASYSEADIQISATLGIVIPGRSRRAIVLASSAHPSVYSVLPHFLSVRNHISVPIGQICFILGTNDKYHGLSISYKFRQNLPLNT